ncbi:Diadenylate cyclase [Methanimicrococcus hongohii]|uniref:Diadenylate cyclase n=1 Tax=Methanimicrococcus hongohii TaxID=3028295 RepID=A0AA96ZTR6_9EURY|nr:diadenylate cyclase [Methanimicrococcus sp. Hf6]WNY23526.1 Diadenylate cyclase [Methanimicrococcus sp. Hf6]
MEEVTEKQEVKTALENPIFNASASDDLCGILLKDSVRHLAKLTEAVAVFTFGNIDTKSFKDLDIPVIDITQIKTIIEKLTYLRNENQFQIQEVSESIKTEADKNASLLMSAAAVEYSLGTIPCGIVLGLIRTQNSYSLVVHSMEENETVQTVRECEKRVTPETFRNVLHLSLNIAMKGREGKKVGTAFVLGDEEEVLERSHQMIINPFRGQDSEININKKETWETVMGFAQLDGVFIISETGKILSAGRYLDVDTRDIHIEKGLGTRHLSSASITRDTNAIAVAISESGGTIRVYMDGKEVVYVEPGASLVVVEGDGSLRTAKPVSELPLD